MIPFPDRYHELPATPLPARGHPTRLQPDRGGRHDAHLATRSEPPDPRTGRRAGGGNLYPRRQAPDRPDATRRDPAADRGAPAAGGRQSAPGGPGLCRQRPGPAVDCRHPLPGTLRPAARRARFPRPVPGCDAAPAPGIAASGGRHAAIGRGRYRCGHRGPVQPRGAGDAVLLPLDAQHRAAARPSPAGAAGPGVPGAVGAIPHHHLRAGLYRPLAYRPGLCPRRTGAGDRADRHGCRCDQDLCRTGHGRRHCRVHCLRSRPRPPSAGAGRAASVCAQRHPPGSAQRCLATRLCLPFHRGLCAHTDHGGGGAGPAAGRAGALGDHI